MTAAELEPFSNYTTALSLSLSERESQSPTTIISLTDWYHLFHSFCRAQEELIHHVSVTLAHLWPGMTHWLLHSQLFAAFITDRDSDLFTTYRSPWKPWGLDQLCIWSVIHAVGTATASLSPFLNTTLEQNAEVRCRFTDSFDSLWIIDPISPFCTALTNSLNCNISSQVTLLYRPQCFAFHFHFTSCMLNSLHIWLVSRVHR